MYNIKIKELSSELAEAGDLQQDTPCYNTFLLSNIGLKTGLRMSAVVPS